MMDRAFGPLQLRIGRLHFRNDNIGELVEEGTLETEQPPVASSAAQDTPQHVAPALIRRQDPVRDHKRDSAKMIGNDAHRPILIFGSPIRPMGELLNRPNDRAKEIRIIVCGFLLHDRRQPL